MSYKVCLWDFDGTMCDSHDGVMYCMDATYLHANSTKADREKLLSLVSKGTKLEDLVYQMFGQDLESSRHSTLVDAYRSCYLKNGISRERLFPSVREIVKALNLAGTPQFVVTNKRETLVRKSLERFGLTSYFVEVFGVGEEYPSKPDPALYHQYIAPYLNGIRPEEVLMIGDSGTDAQFASQAGLTMCFSEFGFGSYPKDLAPAQYTITSVDELYSILNLAGPA